MNRRKQTPIRFLALVMAIATITSFSLFATAQGVIIDNTYEQLMLQQEDAVAANELLNEAFDLRMDRQPRRGCQRTAEHRRGRPDHR